MKRIAKFITRAERDKRRALAHIKTVFDGLIERKDLTIAAVSALEQGQLDKTMFLAKQIERLANKTYQQHEALDQLTTSAIADLDPQSVASLFTEEMMAKAREGTQAWHAFAGSVYTALVGPEKLGRIVEEMSTPQTADDVRRARAAAKKVGWRVVKSRARSPRWEDHGMLRLIDETGRIVTGQYFDVTADRIIEVCERERTWPTGNEDGA